MKTKRKILICVCAFIFVFSLLPHNSQIANAGELTTTLMDNEKLFNTIDENISIREWIVGNGIKFKQIDENTKSVKFGNLSDNSDVFLLRSYPVVVERESPSLEIESEFTINDIVGNKKFCMMFGVQNLSDTPSAADSAMIWFSKKSDNIYYGIDNFSSDLTNPTVVQETILPTNNIKVNIKQYCDKRAEICINNNLVLNGVNFSIGLVGYGQSGNYTDNNNYIDVEILSCIVKNHYYSRPANTNIFLDFSSDHINANEWRVEGNVVFDKGVMTFENAGINTFISTTNKYSNFEMTLDIPYIKREPDFSEDGILLKSASDSIYILCGIEASNPEDVNDYVNAYIHGRGINFRCTGDAASNNGYPANSMRLELGRHDEAVFKQIDDDTGYNLWNPIYKGRVANLRIRVIDGVYSVEVKWDGQSKYNMLFTKDYGFVPDGYIMISAGWNSSGPDVTNISFDNIKITNLDNRPNLRNTDFTPSGVQNNGDYPFIDNRNPQDLVGISNSYDITLVKSDSCCGKITGTVILGAVTIFCIALSVMILMKRGK